MVIEKSHTTYFPNTYKLCNYLSLTQLLEFKLYLHWTSWANEFQINGTWLYGRYKGMLLIAVAQDRANNIFPLAFSIVEGETTDGWHFYLQNLRSHITPQHGICLISDRHKSIKSAYWWPEKTIDNSSHMFYIRHIGQNYKKQFKSEDERKNILSMGNIFFKILIHNILLFKIKLTIRFTFFFKLQGMPWPNQSFFVTTESHKKTTHTTLPG